MITHCLNLLHHPETASAGPCDKRELDLRNDPLVERLQESLRATGYFVNCPCEVMIHVDHTGHVSLSGVVSSYYLKQRAQSAVMSVDGVNSLRNELIVP